MALRKKNSSPKHGKKFLHQKLGKYLKEKRAASGLTQLEVSTRLGYSSAQFISNFERGLCSPPLNNLKTLVQIYNIPPQEIMDLILKEQEMILKDALLGPDKKKKRA